jgi:hypothetical protein
MRGKRKRKRSPYKKGPERGGSEGSREISAGLDAGKLKTPAARDKGDK